jgi:hypothetical protein
VTQFTDAAPEIGDLAVVSLGRRTKKGFPMRKFAMLILFAITFGVGLAGVGHISAVNAQLPDPCHEDIDGF